MPATTQSIREIISTQSSAAAVLQRFDIDLCSHADESLLQACAALQLSVEQVLEKLTDAAASEHGTGPADLAGYSQSRLIQHIVRSHHQYVRHELPRLGEMARKLSAKHGERQPELMRIDALLEALQAEMFAHLSKEEQILFPYIVQMEEEADGCASQARACFQSVAQPVSMMVQEHEMAEGLVAEMRKLANDFNAPAKACATHIALYAGLHLFESDIRQHVHLENDILFPRAIEMEAALSLRR
jgi:regulator of cell morphogenesis and NO signaling